MGAVPVPSAPPARCLGGDCHTSWSDRADGTSALSREETLSNPLVFFSSWLGPPFTQGADGKCSQTREWELLQSPGELKKPEGNLNRVIQRDTSKVIFKCRVSHEAFHIPMCIYNKKRQKKNQHLQITESLRLENASKIESNQMDVHKKGMGGKMRVWWPGACAIPTETEWRKS